MTSKEGTTLNLIDVLMKAVSNSEQATGCKLTQILLMLEKPEQEALNKAIETIRKAKLDNKNSACNTVWLTKVLKSFNYPVSDTTIRRHIRKECTCE